MDVMMNVRAKAAAPATAGRSLKRLEFEMALEIGDHIDRPPAEAIHLAAQAAGWELVIVLPTPEGHGTSAIVRLAEGNRNRFLQVEADDEGYAFFEESEIDPELLGFARSSIDVLERLRADRAVRAPSTEAAA
jgi:hypothetical protein